MADPWLFYYSLVSFASLNNSFAVRLIPGFLLMVSYLPNKFENRYRHIHIQYLRINI